MTTWWVEGEKAARAFREDYFHFSAPWTIGVSTHFCHAYLMLPSCQWQSMSSWGQWLANISHICTARCCSQPGYSIFLPTKCIWFTYPLMFGETSISRGGFPIRNWKQLWIWWIWQKSLLFKREPQHSGLPVKSFFHCCASGNSLSGVETEVLTLVLTQVFSSCQMLWECYCKGPILKFSWGRWPRTRVEFTAAPIHQLHCQMLL